MIGSQDHMVIYEEQVKHLYKLCTLHIATTLVNSFLLMFLLRKVISYTALINWVTAMLLISLFQYVLQQKYVSAGIIKDRQSKWSKLFNTGVALSGLFWGSSAIFLFPPESIIHQLLLALLTCAMLAMAVGVYSAIMGVFLAYSIPAVLPMIIKFLVIGDELHLTVGGVILIFSILMFFAAKGVNTSLKTSLTFKQTHSKAVSHLKKRREATDQPYLTQKRKRATGVEEPEKQKKVQWMTGFDQFKLHLRERNEKKAKQKVPKDRTPKQEKSQPESFLPQYIVRDFSNLFTYIQGKVSLMLMDMRAEQPGYDELKDLEKSIQKGAELTKALSKFGIRPSQEKSRIDLKSQLKKNAQKIVRKKGKIAFHLKSQNQIWHIKADQRAVDKVILGIYADSCRSMPSGGDIYVRTQNVTLGEAFLAPHRLMPGKFVKVSVTYTSSRKDEGGLGRARVKPTWMKELVKKNGGILNAYKDEGSENTWDLYFPANET